MARVALGLAYSGSAYHGWQSQPDGCTVQDHIERAIERFCAQGQRIPTFCAGRTDTGVHALGQVLHFDAPVQREENAWVRGLNTYLPKDIAVRWACVVPDGFHARAAALARRYVYILLDSPVRPSLATGRVGWTFKPVDAQLMGQAAQVLVGEHDFSSFRAAQCQALSPIKTLEKIQVQRHGQLVFLEFQAQAFLHHMVRNIMGCLVYIGQGVRPVEWLQEVLEARSRVVAAPTFAPDGLYFLGPVYDAQWGLPELVQTEDVLRELFV